MKTWTTTRWELEHRSVQGGIEPLRLKSHQALNFKMKLNLISCVLPDFGSLKIYLITKSGKTQDIKFNFILKFKAC